MSSEEIDSELVLDNQCHPTSVKDLTPWMNTVAQHIEDRWTDSIYRLWHAEVTAWTGIPLITLDVEFDVHVRDKHYTPRFLYRKPQS